MHTVLFCFDLSLFFVRLRWSKSRIDYWIVWDLTSINQLRFSKIDPFTDCSLARPMIQTTRVTAQCTFENVNFQWLQQILEDSFIETHCKVSHFGGPFGTSGKNLTRTALNFQGSGGDPSSGPSREPCPWQVNNGSGKGLVPSSTKPLPEPMLTQTYVTIWHH